MSILRPQMDASRYAKQILYEKIGEEGQQKLFNARVTLVGCGALGNALAGTLVRAGVGFLRICDRDFVERDNLQRQILFDEDDVVQNLPKAQAAFRKLALINSEVTIEPAVTDVNHANIEELCRDADLILDGTDNFETRYLINDFAVSSGRPWVYGGVIGATGLCLTIVPGETPCLRCVFDEPPPPTATPTCDTAGVIAPAVQVVAGFQAVEAIKLLTGRRDEINRRLMQLDVWSGRVIAVDVQRSTGDRTCRCCVLREFPYLEGKLGSAAAVLCGRNAVQVRTSLKEPVTLSDLADKLRSVSTTVQSNDYLVRATIGELELTLFPDGRAIVKGTSDPQRARAIYARYVGS